MVHEFVIGSKTVKDIPNFTGTCQQLVDHITTLENETGRILQHYEKRTGWRVIGGVLQPNNKK